MFGQPGLHRPFHLPRRRFLLLLVATVAALFFVAHPAERADAEGGKFVVAPAPEASIPEPLWGQRATFKGETYFVGGPTGHELWKTDGSPEGKSLVIHIPPGPDNYAIEHLTVVGKTLFFSASDEAHNAELWVSDGTAAGTAMVRDIYPGIEHSSPIEFVPFKGELFFFANDGTHKFQLWKSDGTEAGTVEISRVPIPFDSGGYQLTAAGGTLFFSFNDGIHGTELWKSDGTIAGTQLAADINPAPTTPSTGHSVPVQLTNVDGTLFFGADDGVHGMQVWRSDGTETGTTPVEIINPGYGSHHGCEPSFLSSVGGQLFFAADDGIHGRELWRTGGTPSTTSLVADIHPGAQGSVPGYPGPIFVFPLGNAFATVKGKLFFSADDGVHGRELWASNGMEAGAEMVADINAGSGSSYPTNLANVDETLLFTAQTASGGREVWRATEGEADTEPPKLSALSIEPASVEISASEQTVIVEAHITDDASGYYKGGVTLLSPSGKQRAWGDFKRVSGDANEGDYRAEVTVRRFSEAGTWSASALLVDFEFNNRDLGAESLAGLGLPHAVAVEGESDLEPPVLDELSVVPEVVDTSESARVVGFVSHVTDALSGFDRGSVLVRSPSGKEEATSIFFKQLGGTPTSGTYQFSAVLNNSSEAGQWVIAEFHLSDVLGNEVVLGPTQLKELGLPSQFPVVGVEADAQPPQLEELAIEPAAVDTTESKQTIAVTARVSDDLSGFGKGFLSFVSPSGQQIAFAEFGKRSSGTPTDGVYEVPVPVKRFSENGYWELKELHLFDQSGHQTSFDASLLQERGLPYRFHVQGTEDHQAPELADLSIEPAAIDAYSGQPVVVTTQIADDLSGFSEGSISFISPSGQQVMAGAQFTLQSGTATDGVFETPVTLKHPSEIGTWRIQEIRLWDEIGNEAVITRHQLEKEELPFEVEITGDEEAPSLLGLSFEPPSVDLTVPEPTLRLRASFSDDSSGFSCAFADFRSPSGKQTIGIDLCELVSGTRLDGVAEGGLTLKEGFHEPGVWTLRFIRLSDLAGNERTIETGQLAQAGFPTTVTLSVAHPTVTQVNPVAGAEAGGTKVQITGSGFSGATQVRFGSTPAADYTVNFPTMITATAPAGTGTVDVTVTTPAGTSETSPAARFIYAPSVSLTSSPNPSVNGQQVTLTAKVTPTTVGAPLPVGTITFIDGGTTLKVANLSKGSATFKTSALAAGTHKLSAFYSGDSYFGQGGSFAVFQTVEKAATQLSLASSLNPAPYGSAATLKATVEALPPGAGTPAGTVTFKEGEAALGTVQLSGKNASLSLKSLPPGSHQIIATYNGDPNNHPSESAPIVQTIAKATTTTSLSSSLEPAPYGSAATLKATVDPVAPAVGSPDGTVIFAAGEEVLATVSLPASGVVKYALKSTLPGDYEITATYSGSSGYEASTATISQTIVKAATEVSLTSTLDPAPYGSSASVKAIVDPVSPGGGVPEGTVTFHEGATVLATVPLPASGVVKYALKSTLPGDYEITATYSGSANYEPSSAAISQTIVKAATELTLTSSKNPAPNGASGNLRAAVKAIAPGAGTPTGSVVFSEGYTVLASVPLAAGVATLPLKSLSVGTHEVTATFGGSGGYLGSESLFAQAITP